MDSVHVETPSRGLLGAVLERAMRDATGPLGTGSTACTPRERERAWAWFRGSSVEPMSFRWLCLVLDLDPDGVMRHLRPPGEDSGTPAHLLSGDRAAVDLAAGEDPAVSEKGVAAAVAPIRGEG